MLPELLHYFVELLGWGTYKAIDKIIESHDKKTRIILRSASSEGGLESSTGQGAWLDECGQDEFTIDAWEAVQRRLSINQGRVLMTTTPYNLGWLKTQVYDRWVGGDSDYDVVNFRSIDNPVFPIAEYERAKRTLPYWKFAMFYDGLFVKPAGLIIESYDESKHVVKAFRIPDEWRRVVGVDFGAVNTALVWLAVDGSKYFVYREKHGGGLTQPEHARAALEYKEPVSNWWGGSRSEDAQRMDWNVSGVPVVKPIIADVEAGLDRINGLFKQDRLFVFDGCNGLRSELGTYSRELDLAGEPTEKIDNKASYHRIDALRYGCSAFPLHIKDVVENKVEHSIRSVEAIREHNDYRRERIVETADEYI